MNTTTIRFDRFGLEARGVDLEQAHRVAAHELRGISVRIYRDSMTLTIEVATAQLPKAVSIFQRLRWV